MLISDIWSGAPSQMQWIKVIMWGNTKTMVSTNIPDSALAGSTPQFSYWATANIEYESIFDRECTILHNIAQYCTNIEYVHQYWIWIYIWQGVHQISWTGSLQQKALQPSIKSSGNSVWNFIIIISLLYHYHIIIILGNNSWKKECFLSGIARITSPPPEPQCDI